MTEGASTTKELLAYNDRVAPFDNVKVRKALARAIDKAKLLNSIWGDYGTLIGSFVPPTDPWYVDLTGVDAYDLESAKALLAEAGYPDGFEFTLDTPDYDPHPIVAQFLQAELRQGRRQGEHQHHHRQRVVHQDLQEPRFPGDAAGARQPPRHRLLRQPGLLLGLQQPRRGQADRRCGSRPRPIDEQTAKLTEANKLIAEDAASNWLYLYPQIVVSAANVTGYPVNGLNSQFFAYDIKKAN